MDNKNYFIQTVEHFIENIPKLSLDPNSEFFVNTILTALYVAMRTDKFKKFPLELYAKAIDAMQAHWGKDPKWIKCLAFRVDKRTWAQFAVALAKAAEREWEAALHWWDLYAYRYFPATRYIVRQGCSPDGRLVVVCDVDFTMPDVIILDHEDPNYRGYLEIKNGASAGKATYKSCDLDTYVNLDEFWMLTFHDYQPPSVEKKEEFEPEAVKFFTLMNVEAVRRMNDLPHVEQSVYSGKIGVQIKTAKSDVHGNVGYLWNYAEPINYKTGKVWDRR